VSKVNGPVFPRRRAGGSFSVAIRYAVSDSGAVQVAQERISSWIGRKKSGNNLDIATELASPPKTDLIDSQTMQVVFDCRSSSALWKGLMVELAQELSTIGGIERLGFWDLVTGLPHPASIEP